MAIKKSTWGRWMIGRNAVLEKPISVLAIQCSTSSARVIGCWAHHYQYHGPKHTCLPFFSNEDPDLSQYEPPVHSWCPYSWFNMVTPCNLKLQKMCWRLMALVAHILGFCVFVWDLFGFRLALYKLWARPKATQIWEKIKNDRSEKDTESEKFMSPGWETGDLRWFTNNITNIHMYIYIYINFNIDCAWYIYIHYIYPISSHRILSYPIRSMGLPLSI